MTRRETIFFHFQKAGELTVAHATYREHITELFEWMISADRVDDDVTSNTLSLTGKGKAQIVSKQEGVIAGIEELTFLLKKNTSLRFVSLVSDGAPVSKNKIVAEVSGDNTEILAFERAILNIIGRMSGVATETATLIASLKHVPTAPEIAAIRKTPLMMIDKKAVAVGGGLTHRLNLSDSILIKDNHLAMLQETLHLGSLEQATEEAVLKCMHSQKAYFEIEVDTITEADAVISTFTKENAKQNQPKMMALLLDNFQPEQAKKFVDSLRMLPVYEHILVEASGEINKTNLSLWATTGVDVVSMGALTHSPKVFNFSMSY